MGELIILDVIWDSKNITIVLGWTDKSEFCRFSMTPKQLEPLREFIEESKGA